MASNNVLFIAIDDLASWIGPGADYHGTVHAPNLERLAAGGMTFTHAFTPEALCNPARTAILSGLNPTTTQVHDNEQAWFRYVDPRLTLPALLKDAGYEVGGFGKVFHTTTMPQSLWGQMFDVYQPLTGFQGGPPANPVFGPLPGSVPASSMADYITADQAIDFLAAQAGSTQPFMLNVGFVKPHLDWVVPQEYFDLYPLDEIVIPGAVGDDMSNIPAFIRDQIVDGNGHPLPLTELNVKQFIQAYLASISFMDAQLGRLLDALDASGEAASTAIVLWSDHGYHFGDHGGLWGKFSLWEEAARTTLYVTVPGVTEPGSVSDQVVSLMDIFPTVLGIAGIRVPASAEGKDLAPFLADATLRTDDVAYTWMYGSFAVRSNDHAYIRYEDGSEEFYDLLADPDETHNLAGDPAARALMDSYHQRAVEEFHVVEAMQAGRSYAGSAAADVLIAPVAGATLNGGAGDDSYFVGAGDVVIVEAANGGHDVVFLRSDYVMAANIEVAVVQQYAGRDVARVVGNALDNSIDGATGGEFLAGEGGNDSLFGEAGDDTLDGGIGNDQLRGYFGNDSVYGAAGDDNLQGELGDDTLAGGAGADRLDGAAGVDTASYRDSASAVTIRLADGYAAGGSAERDVLVGIEGLAGSDAGDSLGGDAQANPLAGWAGNDTLRGLDGNDVLEGGAGADSLDGGAGFDTLDFVHSAAGVEVRLYAQSATGGDATGDRYAGIEGLAGSAGSDVLAGDAFENRIDGRAGNDTLAGGAGNDTLAAGEGDDLLYGGPGLDVLDGGAGYDTVDYLDSAIGVAVTLVGSVTGGGAQGDRLVGIEAVRGSAWDDALSGSAARNRLEGAGGSDSLAGADGGDRLLGGGGADVLTGGASRDTLSGGAGDDTLLGGTGADRLVLDGGNDRVAGGAGRDDFLFTAPGAGSVRIVDFSVSEDSLQLAGTAFAALEAGPLAADRFVRGSAALDADDNLIYDPASGALYYDPDGNGVAAAVQFAQLARGLELSSADIVVV